MSKFLQHIAARTYKPLLVKYLSKTRVYQHNDIQLTIPPQVFHPGFFFSTQLLLQYIDKLDLDKKEFLEMGCGSGLISIVAAKKGAVVTSSDINIIAIAELRKNSAQNNVSIEIIASDLFAAIPIKQFDVIAINPPFYKKQPLREKDYAWYCGEKGEYFSVFFKVLKEYVHSGTKIFMVLFEGADMKMINGFAVKNNFELRLVHRKKNLLEENFIFKIEKIL